MNSDQLETRVRARLDSLTKPKGSLGRLEEVALQFALIRGEEMPSLTRKGMYVFCADHGVTEEGISPFPKSVTRQMVANFVAGGAAINVLCRRHDIQPIIVDAGVEGPSFPAPVLDRKVGPGTRNFARQPAMTRAEAERALAVGADAAREAAQRFDLVGIGEMGIGNTTSAAALFSAFTGFDPEDTVGMGTGLNAAGITHKAGTIRRAIELHHPDPADGLGVLAALGGFEIAAMAGLILAAGELRLPVVVDGFPSGAAAVVAHAINPDCLRSVFFSHLSAERGHRLMLRHLEARPLVSLEMRLGEGTGAAIAIGLIESAVALYREMATFEEASVDRSSL